MSNKNKVSLRYIQIDKSNATIVIVIAVAAACTVFSIVALRALWGQASYNKRVIKAKESTVKRLDANIASLDSLKNSYQTFVNEPVNVIGGSASGNGDRDGDNAKITLDSMPSVYDFPGTISGINKVISGRGVDKINITGKDDEVAKSSAQGSISPVPLSISAEGSPEGIQDFLKVLDLSIRPMNVKTVSLTGDETGKLTATVELDTYYQPKKKFEVKTEVIK